MSAFFDYMHFGLVLLGASLWCFGFHIVVKEFLYHALDIKLNKVGVWESFPKWARNMMKPTFACPYCMSSIHGSSIFFMALFGSFSLYWWPAFCVCLCGLNYIINSMLPEYE